MRLLLATRNAGKLAELHELLAGLPLELLSLDDAGIPDEIPETGDSFLENAVLKAGGYARLSGLITLADDSGLEVRALGGAPGVQSARWAGPNASDRDRIDLLLQQLQGVPPSERQAQFHCVVAIAEPAHRMRTTEGILCGVILDAPRGEGGFGYDPVFYIPELGRSVAELTREEKNRISHRALAVRAARPILEDLLAGEKEGPNHA